MSDEMLVNDFTTFNKEKFNDYQKYLSSKKEWPGININIDKSKIKLVRYIYL